MNDLVDEQLNSCGVGIELKNLTTVNHCCNERISGEDQLVILWILRTTLDDLFFRLQFVFSYRG